MTDATSRHLHETANAILYRALDLPVGDRQQFIAQASAGEPALFEDVRAMLSRIEQLDEFLEDPLELPVEQKAPAPLQPSHGDLIGDWKVEHELGRNGSDLILLVRRAGGSAHGAGLATMRLAQEAGRGGHGVARFERQRDHLAALDHPAIARPGASAVTADGRAYFVVERVSGVPIDQYCARQGLDLGQRAALFATVCDAVHYMHQHLIIHRDLKPADLVVTPAGTISVLDVGMVGDGWAVDPAYASPDVMAGQPLSVSADIYALGAVFYRLVTGRYAHGVDAGVVKHAGAAPVPAPSQAISGKAGLPLEQLDDAALAATPALVAQLRRHIDPIVARALAVDPALRYASAHALARDLERAAASLLAVVDDRAAADPLPAPGQDAMSAPVPAPAPAYMLITPTLAEPRRVPLALAVAMLLAGLVGGVWGGPWLEQKAIEQGLIKRSRIVAAPTGKAASAPVRQALERSRSTPGPATPATFASALALADKARAAGDLEGARQAASEALALSATLPQSARDLAAGAANAHLGVILGEQGQAQAALAALRRALALDEAHAVMDGDRDASKDTNKDASKDTNKDTSKGAGQGVAQADAGRAAADVQQAIARVLAGSGDDAGAEQALVAARALYVARLKAAPRDAVLHERLLSIEMALALAQNAQKHGRDTVATLAGLRRLAGAAGEPGVDLLEAYVQPRGTADKAYAAAQAALTRLRQRGTDGDAGVGADDAAPARALARALTMTGEIGLRARQSGPACANFDEAGKLYDQLDASGRLNAYDRTAVQRLAGIRQACQ